MKGSGELLERVYRHTDRLRVSAICQPKIADVCHHSSSSIGSNKEMRGSDADPRMALLAGQHPVSEDFGVAGLTKMIERQVGLC